MRENVSFQACDNVTLRGWFYAPDSAAGRLPCLVMAPGFTAVKEMDLDTFAEYFCANLPICCLVFDNRGFGDSDVAPGHPRLEIIPTQQQSDYSDAITYAQSRSEVNPDKIGIWGSSYSGGHVLVVGAVDRRVCCVLSQMPCVDGWENFHRLIRPDFVAGLNQAFQSDRQERAKGNPAGVIPVVDRNVFSQCALPTPDSYEYFSKWGEKSAWKNEVTVKSIEALRAFNPSSFIHHISPTPLLMTVGSHDAVTPAELALEAYSRAREPKRLHIIPGGHFQGYSGPIFERSVRCQADFLDRHLCSKDD
ncbi:hypothetical protein E4U42_006816 [Claviceps africana]|uniref:Xaa-Pro dipeptidyl-peptidase-like domain-containing protein n=1 Tax=Claviceps africana TaxID=83212 RepID=A0A8K0NGK0_9HYPO|nr:hypothetical protein E4U42_006816 [Claviceps africana]